MISRIIAPIQIVLVFQVTQKIFQIQNQYVNNANILVKLVKPL
jgi:hypothetical protein